VHLANGDHEAYAKAGVYDRPQGTHDYCKENAYQFDQRQGTVEIYLWNGSDFSPAPTGLLRASRTRRGSGPAGAGAISNVVICSGPRDHSGLASTRRRRP
jgi:hypothetical protein